MLKICVIIPARMAASRFPGKPLAMIAGLPMIEHIRRRSLLAPSVANVVVATCDQEIKDVVESYGGIAVMTSDRHERCTERVAEAAKNFDADVIINVQGDEPLMFPESITQAATPFFENNSARCVSLLSPLESSQDFSNPNIVKAVCRFNREVLYLSRSAVPYFQKKGVPFVYRETGIRAMSAHFLQVYANLAETELERVESVDMLRVLEHGFSIVGVPTEYATMGVDHYEDVAVVERILETDPVQKALHKSIM